MDNNKSWFLKSYLGASAFYFFFFILYQIYYPPNPDSVTNPLWWAIFIGLSLLWPIFSLGYPYLILSSIYNPPTEQIPQLLVLIFGPPLIFYLLRLSFQEKKILGQEPNFTMILSVIISLITFVFSKPP